MLLARFVPPRQNCRSYSANAVSTSAPPAGRHPPPKGRAATSTHINRKRSPVRKLCSTIPNDCRNSLQFLMLDDVSANTSTSAGGSAVFARALPLADWASRTPGGIEAWKYVARRPGQGAGTKF